MEVHKKVRKTGKKRGELRPIVVWIPVEMEQIQAIMTIRGLQYWGSPIREVQAVAMDPDRLLQTRHITYSRIELQRMIIPHPKS